MTGLYLSFGKRLFDLLFAIVGFFVLSPFFVLIAILIKLDSKGPVFFLQKRMGKDGKPFKLIKFRSMYVDPVKEKQEFTPGDSSRITRIGRIIRKTKIDELPELINVIKGDMSLVGPRPEVPRFWKLFYDDFKDILVIRPGITDYASIRFRDEEKILSKYENKEKGYIEDILPYKIELNKRYLKNITLRNDIRLILKTLRKVLCF